MRLSTRTLYQQASKANGQHLEENDGLFGKHPRVLLRFSRIAVSNVIQVWVSRRTAPITP
jgi:hypothetical protein